MIKHSCFIFIPIVCLGFCGPAFGDTITATKAETKMASGVDRSKFPQPVFDQDPGYVDLYWQAGDLAYAHVLSQPGLALGN